MPTLLLSSVTCSNTLLPAILPSSLPNFQPCLQPILDTKTRRHSLGTFRTVNLVFPFFNKCSVSHYKPPRLFFFILFLFSFSKPVSQSVSRSVTTYGSRQRVNQQVQRGPLNVNSTYFLLFVKWPQKMFQNMSPSLLLRVTRRLPFPGYIRFFELKIYAPAGLLNL